MSERAKYTQVYTSGEVTNDNACLEIAPENVSNSPNNYHYIEKLNLSVYKAAIGGGGICQLQDTRGNVYFTWSVDGVQVFPPLDGGDYGVKVESPANVGLNLVLSGADVQASVSAMYKGHIEPK